MFAKTTQRLCWKELKQVLPLAVMLVVIGVCLQAFFLISNETTQKYATLGIMIGLPGLFAVGAGALMVGQEKEQRTLYWLSTLPLPSSNIFWTKLLIACCILLALWPLSVAIAAIFSMPQGGLGALISSSMTNDALPLATWPLHSLFVLLSGFALAWYLQNSLKALVLLLPIAFLPTLVASLITQTILENTGRYSVTTGPSVPALLACQTVGCIIALTLCYRSAIAALSPARPARISKTADERDKTRKVFGPPHTPWSALLWQNLTQSKWLLLFALAITIVPPILHVTHLVGDDYFPVAAIAGLLSIWLIGVGTFQGDQLNGRVRFMADRGIAPGQLWRSRLLTPATAAVACVAILFVGWLLGLREPLDLFTTITGAIIAVGMAAWVYVASQWSSQISTGPIVAAVVGLACSIGAVAYFMVCIETLGTPLWLALAIAGLPLLATRLATRRWMDCTRGRPFWFIHIMSAALFVLIPAVPMVVTLATAPKLSPNFIAAMQELTPQSRMPELSLTLAAPSTPEDQLAPDTRLTSEKIAASIAHLNRELRLEGRSISCEYRVERFIVNQLAFQSELQGSDAPAREPNFAAVVSLATRLVNKMRRTPDLQTQDAADRIEIALLRELLSESANKLPEEVRAAAKNLLSDRNGRQLARQKAIASAWLQTTQSNEIGGYSKDYGRDIPNARSLLRYRQEAAHMLEQLWKISKAGDLDTTRERRLIAQFWGASEAYYGLGPDGEAFRADGSQRHLPGTWVYAPGSQWQAAWERVAETL